MLHSTLKFIEGIPFTSSDNYIIDDYNLYIESLNDPVATHYVYNFQFQPVELEKEIIIGKEQKDSEAFKLYNYVYITSYNELGTQQGTPTGYFVTNISWGSAKSIIIDLKLDFLNTYSQNLEFTPSTFIIRQHKNRFSPVKTIYGGTTYFSNIFYLDDINIRYKEQKVKELLLPSTYIKSPDNVEYPVIWLKIVVKQSTGVNTLLLTLDKDFYAVYNSQTFLIKSFESYTDNQLTVLLGCPDIWEISLLPYPPHDVFKNIKKNDVTVTISNLPQFYQALTYPIQYQKEGTTYSENYDVLFVRGMDNIKAHRTLFSNPIKLNYSYEADNITFNRELHKYLISGANTNLLNQLKTTVAENGVIKDLAMNNSSEPQIFTNSFLDVKINYLNYFYNVCLEKIKISNLNGYINEIFDYPANDRNPNNLLTIEYLPNISVSNGGTFCFSKGLYTTYPVEYLQVADNVQIPLCTNSALEYQKDYYNKEKEAILKREKINERRQEWEREGWLTSKIKTAGSWIANEGIDYVNKGVGVVKSVAPNIGRVLSQAARGNMVGAAISLGMGLFGKDEENDINSSNITNYESALNENVYYKANYIIKMAKKSDMEKWQRYHYLFGQPENTYNVPSHNNRILFDYLQCQPVFLNKLKCSDEIFNAIIESFNDGVYYIHKFNNSWNFPTENDENLEVAIYNTLPNP